jgi:hypothetical protein
MAAEIILLTWIMFKEQNVTDTELQVQATSKHFTIYDATVTDVFTSLD